MKYWHFSLLFASVPVEVSALSQPMLAGSGKKVLKSNKQTLLTISYQNREDLLCVMRNIEAYISYGKSRKLFQ